MLTKNLVDDLYCQGITYQVEDIDRLAQAIALILVSEYTLATELIRSENGEGGTLSLDATHIEDIIKRRLHPADIYHRDGFLFQLTMWLASHLDLAQGDLVSLPHSQGTQKGQDAIVVHRSANAIAAVSICEDKATGKPRKTLRDKVWPEIEAYERGERRDEIQSNIISTLGTGGVARGEAEMLVRAISWAGKRRYRVRMTVGDRRTKHLFRGFPSKVAGTNDRRRGETTSIPKLRQWMELLSNKVEVALRQFVGGT